MDLVTVVIDGKEVKVPKGANLIEAARIAGIEVPHYCYHPNLSIAGNCRMCQVKVEGQPKLTIACNTRATEGMKVSTHLTSADVADAQRATLEFLLINHPLDCTVCDQAGHCKLQDYYYEYNSKGSRFIENKEHKVKAEVLGPEIVYDGERCILCTRCTRFCSEVTKTSELGIFNRGDRSVVGVFPGRDLDNPLSGTVADLCPVGALTHRRWRFNTRIWYTTPVSSICTGCSTGCNCTVASREGRVVHVKGRLNQDVNKEWMCDEGRYGFERFQPEERLEDPALKEGGVFRKASWAEALKAACALKEGGDCAVFLSPFLTLEEMWLAGRFAREVMGAQRIAVQIKKRPLTPEQAVLVSPDYAPNARAALTLGLIETPEPDWRAVMQARYEELLRAVRSGSVQRILFVGDYAAAFEDADEELLRAVSNAAFSAALTPRAAASKGVHTACKLLLPGQTVNEKNGLMVNAQGRIQRLRLVLGPQVGSYPEWNLLARMAKGCGVPLLGDEVTDERALLRALAGHEARFSKLTLASVGELGKMLEEA